MSYYINKILLLTFFSLLFFGSKLFTIAPVEINLPREFSSDGFKLYNTLPEVEIANEKLQKSRSFEQFLVEARELAQEHNLEESMGIRLIHRHTDITDNEIMVEKHENFKGQDALVTRPASKISETEAAPASWIFDGEQYHVFEYSYDAHVPKVVEAVKNSPDFLNKFASLLKKYSYQNLIALAITDREWFQNYVGKNSFLEQSYNEPTFASVVTADELEDANSITTAWSFKIDPITCHCAMITTCISTADLGHMKYTKHEYVT